MERFAFKIDNALKANLYKICRLCGIDHPFMISITDYEKNKDVSCNDPTLCYKILNLVGLTVHKRDNMPQSACNSCVDKINDFFEFRETCLATDAQTRNLLGIKVDNPSLSTEKKSGRKRKTDEVIDITDEDDKYALRKKLKIEDPKSLCNICKERFPNEQKLQAHLTLKHIPYVPRYACYACDHIIHLPSEVKDHEMWHKVSKTSYQCGFCDTKLTNKHAYTRHLRQHTQATATANIPVLKECPQCHKTFQTCYLYNIHTCALRTQSCGGCNKVSRSVPDLTKHLARCLKAYKKQHAAIPAAPSLNEFVRIKNENIVDPPVVPAEAMTVINVKQEFQNNLDRVDNLLRQTINVFQDIRKDPDPKSQHQENNENHSGDYQFEDDHHDDNEYTNTGDISLNINEPIVKLEVGENNNKKSAEPPLPRLKIKLEHGTLNSSILNGEQQETTTEATNQDNGLPPIRIKQELIEEEVGAESTLEESSSSIQIASVSSGVSFEAERHEISDVKPNRLELDRLMNLNIESVATTRSIKTEPIESAAEVTNSNVRIKMEPMSTSEVIPKISSVSSGESVLKMREGFRIKTEIKSEPCDYDEQESVWQPNESGTFSGTNIKQEPATALHINANNCDTAQPYIKQEQQEEEETETAVESETNDKSHSVEITEENVPNVNENENPKSLDDENLLTTENVESDKEKAPEEVTEEDPDVIEVMNDSSSKQITTIELDDDDEDDNDILEVMSFSASTSEVTQKNNTFESLKVINFDSMKTPATTEPTIVIDEILENSQLSESIQSEVTEESGKSSEQNKTIESLKVINIDNMKTPTTNEETVVIDDIPSETQTEVIENITSGELSEKSNDLEALKDIESKNLEEALNENTHLNEEAQENEVEMEKNVISGEVNLDKELTNQSPPTQETIECEIEEQQNELNQRMANVTDENENNKSNVDEVSENILNEGVEEEHEVPCIMNRIQDNDNINEIAENNNNANIERELQEVNAASQAVEATPASTAS